MPKDDVRLRREYEGLLGGAEAFSREVVRQLQHLLAKSDVALGFPLESRVKSWLSIEEKLRRKELSLASILDLHDLIGVRVVLLFARDAPLVIEAIKAHFEIFEVEDAGERLGGDRFGYLSTHCIVKLKSEWSKLPTLSGLPEFKVEVQVRTLAQHIWAAASHRFQYKQEQSVPLPIRRAFGRVAALLEMVDLELERVLEERSEYRELLFGSSQGSLKHDQLDVDVLESVLDEMLPMANKGSEEPYDGMLASLVEKGVTSVGALRQMVKAELPRVLKKEALYVERNRLAIARDQQVTGTSKRRAEQGVYFSHQGLLRGVLKYF